MKIVIFICFCLTIIFASSILAAPPPGEVINTDSKSIDSTSYINANKILMFVANQGSFAFDAGEVFGYDAGAIYPYINNDYLINYKLNNDVLYKAGVWIGGKVNGEIRIAASEYGTEFVPGPMSGGTYLPDDPSFKVYKLYADSLESNPNADYLNWPVDQGAPVDGQGKPLMIGDQMLWSVFNDADPLQHTIDPGSTAPLGVEIQLTVYAFDEDGDQIIPLKLYPPVIQTSTQRVEVSIETVNRDLMTGHDYMVVTELDAAPDPIWHLIDVTLASTVLADRTDFTGAGVDTADGMVIRVTTLPSEGDSWEYASADPANISSVALDDYPDYDTVRVDSTGRWFSGAGNGELLFGGVYLGPQWEGSTLAEDEFKPVRIDFRPIQSYTDLTGDGQYTIGEPYVAGEGPDTSSAFMYYSWSGDTYEGFYEVPFSAYDISDPGNPRKLIIVVRDKDQNLQWDLDTVYDPEIPSLPHDGDLQYNYVWILNDDYDATGTRYDDGSSGINFMSDYSADMPVQWVIWLNSRDIGGMLAEEGSLTLHPTFNTVMQDTFSFTAEPPPLLTTGPDGVSIYLKYKIYNKGSNNIDSCYFGLWVDPDLGGAGDDLTGCDTLNDMFFCYNGEDDDFYYGENPPAVGFKYLYGPQVPGGQAAIAYFDGKWLPGHRNLGMTAFHTIFNALDPDNATQSFRYMKGLNQDGSEYTYDGHVTRYKKSGDPVTGTGDLDNNPADRRMFSASGPFTMAPGESQFVLIKMAIGQAEDRLSSITAMKEILNSNPIVEYPSGDANSDGICNVGDAVFLVHYIYSTGIVPHIPASGDANCDGRIDIGDVVYIMNYIFNHGPLPCHWNKR